MQQAGERPALRAANHAQQGEGAQVSFKPISTIIFVSQKEITFAPNPIHDGNPETRIKFQQNEAEMHSVASKGQSERKRTQHVMNTSKI